MIEIILVFILVRVLSTDQVGQITEEFCVKREV